MLGSLSGTLARLTDFFLKLRARHCPLTTALPNEFPKCGIAAKFQLFRIKTFDANNQSDWLAISGNHDPFVLRFTDASRFVSFSPITFIGSPQ